MLTGWWKAQPLGQCPARDTKAEERALRHGAFAYVGVRDP